MEIKQPKDLNDTELLTERVMVFREMARLTVYLSALNGESSVRCPEGDEGELIPLFQ